MRKENIQRTQQASGQWIQSLVREKKLIFSLQSALTLDQNNTKRLKLNGQKLQIYHFD